MTSLIDVIFLLLLFFMLTSTFTRFSEIELTTAARSVTPGSEAAPLFLQLAADEVRLNGDTVPLAALAEAVERAADAPADAPPRPLLVSLRDGVTAQRLTDVLVAIRGVPNIAPTILGAAS
jgi:biopolymer transport protein ExbD